MQLRRAMKAEAATKRETLVRHAVRQAYVDNTVLIAILRKILPDLKAIDTKITQDSPFRLIIDLSPSPKTGAKQGQKPG